MAFQAQQGKRNRLTDLVITQTADVSNMLNSDQYSQYTELAILAPAGTFDGTIGPECNIDPSLDETNDDQWKTYHPSTPGTTLAFPAAVLTVFPSPPTHGFRLKSSSAEDPALTFKVWGLLKP